MIVTLVTASDLDGELPANGAMEHAMARLKVDVENATWTLTFDEMVVFSIENLFPEGRHTVQRYRIRTNPGMGIEHMCKSLHEQCQ